MFGQWGEKVCEFVGDHNSLIVWNGKTNNGKDLAQQDVYIWVVEAKDHNQAKHKFVGQVTLIR